MHMEEAKRTQSNHCLTMEDRSFLTVSGVTEVVSFDEESVVLDTMLGRMTVEGASLHVQRLDLSAGIVSVEGSVDGIAYEAAEGAGDSHRRRWLFGRLG